MRNDDESGLLVVDWPRHRPSDFPISSEVFDALVVMVNIERMRAHEIAMRALAVCDRWDADDVNAGAMDRDIGQLRRVIAGET